MNQFPLQVATISLTLAQLLILRRVYQETKKHPIVFTIEKGFVDWDVLVAYRLLYRRAAKFPTGEKHIEYKLTPLGATFMKSLEV